MSKAGSPIKADCGEGSLKRPCFVSEQEANSRSHSNNATDYTLKYMFADGTYADGAAGLPKNYPSPPQDAPPLP